MRRRSLVVGLVVLVVALVALASQPAATPTNGGLVELFNAIAQMVQSVFIMGAGITIIVVAVRAGRKLGGMEQKMDDFIGRLDRYVARNDESHSVMNQKIEDVSTRTARLEGASGRRTGRNERS